MKVGLDTISFKYEEMKKEYDRQCAAEQVVKDSLFRDSLFRSVAESGGTWKEDAPQSMAGETPYFMPEWKFPLLSGDTIYSDSIQAQFLFLDLWYISCHPCRMAMRELTSIDTLFDESLLKFVSLNIGDQDTAKIRQVVDNLNIKSDIACTYDNRFHTEMSKQMGGCQGYPQLYLIDMNTKQVIWHSCGWRDGFTKEIKEIMESKSLKRE